MIQIIWLQGVCHNWFLVWPILADLGLSQSEFAESVDRLTALFGPEPNTLLLARCLGWLDPKSVCDRMLPIGVLNCSCRPFKRVHELWLDHASLRVLYEGLNASFENVFVHFVIREHRHLLWLSENVRPVGNLTPIYCVWNWLAISVRNTPSFDSFVSISLRVDWVLEFSDALGSDHSHIYLVRISDFSKCLDAFKRLDAALFLRPKSVVWPGLRGVENTWFHLFVKILEIFIQLYKLVFRTYFTIQI